MVSTDWDSVASSAQTRSTMRSLSRGQEDIMARRVIDHIGEIAEQLRNQGDEAERLGRLPDDTAKVLKAAGPIKLLQPRQYGGFEAHPREFAETVMAVAALDGAAGWVCGVVGVHPWQLAFADPKSPRGGMGRRRQHLDGVAVCTHRAGRADRRWLRVQRALAVQLGDRPLRLDIPRRPAGQRRTAASPIRRACCT